MTKTYLNFIGGKWQCSASGEVFENRNPANTRDLIGVFPESDRADVEKAVQAAKNAFDGWRLTPAPKRGEIIMKAGLILQQRKKELANLMTREMGKVTKEAMGDVQEAIDMAFYVAGEGRRLFGETTPSELPNKLNFTLRMPVGVCGLITPWNFPMAIPSWHKFCHKTRRRLPCYLNPSNLIPRPRWHIHTKNHIGGYFLLEISLY